MWLLRGSWLWGVCFILLTMLSSRPAAADAATVTAEALFRQGRDAMQRQDYETACARFAESNRLDVAAGTLMNLATCEEKLGRVATAWQHWREAIDLLPAGDDRYEDVILSTTGKPNHLAVEVFATEKMGSYNVVDVKFAEEITRVRTLPSIRLEIGKKAYITFDMERIRIFDRQNEQAIMQERR